MPKTPNPNKPGASTAWKEHFKCYARKSKAPDPRAFQMAHELASSQELFWRDIIEIAFNGGLLLPKGGVKITTPTCFASRTSTQTIPANTYTPIVINHVEWDNNAFIDLGAHPTRITFRSAGLYLVGATLNYQQNKNAERQVAFYKNNSIGFGFQIAEYTTSGWGVMTTTSLMFFDKNDYMELLARTTDGSDPASMAAFWALAITPEQVV